MKDLIFQLQARGGSDIVWLSASQKKTLRILERRDIILVLKDWRDQGRPVSLALSPEARLAPGMQEQEAA
jgi:hypothetical protein